MTYTLMGYIIYLKIRNQGKEEKQRSLVKRKQGEDRMEQYTVTGMSCAACSSACGKSSVQSAGSYQSCSVSLLTNSMGVEGTASRTGYHSCGGRGRIRSFREKGSPGQRHRVTAAEEDALEDKATPVLKRRLICISGISDRPDVFFHGTYDVGLAVCRSGLMETM